MADPPGGPSRDRLGINKRNVLASFRPHVLFYALAAIAMIVVDLTDPADAWAAWPVMVWGALLIFHYMAVKLLTADDGWVEERTGDVLYKAYDQGHMTDIKDSPGMAPAARKEKGRGNGEPPVSKT